MEAIKISSFGKNEIQNAEWYATSIEELAASEGSCIGDKGYLLVENMPMYIKKSNGNNQEDWQFIGNKYGGSLSKPIPYEYMPDGYPKVETEDVIYEINEVFPEGWIHEGTCYIPHHPVVELIAGDKYIITLNDKVYERIAESPCTDYVVLGNKALDDAEPDTGEPFCLVYDCQFNPISYAVIMTDPGKTNFKVVHVHEEIIYENTISVGVEEMYYVIMDAPELKVGDTYKVLFDGKEYMCEAWRSKLAGRIGIGNDAIMGLPRFGGDEPFLFTFDVGAAEFIGSFTEAGEHSIKITHCPKKYTKIDEQFLYVPIIYTEINGRPTGLNMSHNELRHALEMGFPAVMSLGPGEDTPYREIKTMTFCRLYDNGATRIWFDEYTGPVEIDSAGNFIDTPM